MGQQNDSSVGNDAYVRYVPKSCFLYIRRAVCGIDFNLNKACKCECESVVHVQVIYDI